MTDLKNISNIIDVKRFLTDALLYIVKRAVDQGDLDDIKSQIIDQFKQNFGTNTKNSTENSIDKEIERLKKDIEKFKQQKVSANA